MNKMKIIDIFNKIANGEETPKKIKYKTWTFIYVDEFYGYMKENYLTASRDEIISFNACIVSMEELNDEVEILEEEKKLPEKLEEIGNINYNLGYIDYKNIEVLKDWLNKDIQSILNELDLIVKNQNQLIDYLESKEKGE